MVDRGAPLEPTGSTIMWAFIIAAIVLVGSAILAWFVAMAEGMATAPVYDDGPQKIFVFGIILAALIAASHWLPHLGW